MATQQQLETMVDQLTNQVNVAGFCSPPYYKIFKADPQLKISLTQNLKALQSSFPQGQRWIDEAIQHVQSIVDCQRDSNPPHIGSVLVNRP